MDKDKIEQKCFAIAAWMHRRGEALLFDRVDIVERSDKMIDRLLKEIKEICNGNNS